MSAEANAAREAEIDALVAREFDAIVNQCELQVLRDRLAYYTKARISVAFDHGNLTEIDTYLKTVLRLLAEQEL